MMKFTLQKLKIRLFANEVRMQQTPQWREDKLSLIVL